MYSFMQFAVMFPGVSGIQMVQPWWENKINRVSEQTGGLDVECKRFAISKYEEAKVACKSVTRTEMDPHQMLIGFEKLFREKIPIAAGELVMLSRPVSDRARSFLCKGEAVGKGFDIKPKSSRLIQGVGGFVSACQACSWSAPQSIDTTVANTTDDINITIPSAAAGGGFCEKNNPLNGEKCSISNRTQSTGDQKLQHYAHELITDLEKDKPSTVKGRKCLLLEVDLSHADLGPKVSVPFFAYEGLDGKTLPIVSDYDLLFIGEKPVPSASGAAKYPLMNDAQYFDTNLPANFPKLVSLTLELKCGGDENTANDLKAVTKGLVDKLYTKGAIGLASPTMEKLLTGLIAESAKTTGAFRHGAENENYMAPQPFEDSIYPFFDDGKAYPMFDDEANDESVRGEAGVVRQYKIELAKGTCVPMNFNWLGKDFNSIAWKQVWDTAQMMIKSGGPLDGCAYYQNEIIVNAVNKYMTCAPNMLGPSLAFLG